MSSAPRVEDQDRVPRGVAAVVILVGAVVRTWDLGGQGLWADEAATATWAMRPLDALLATLAGDNQAPLYLLLVRGVQTLLGTGEWQARLPSAVASCASVPALAWAALPLVGARAAWSAAALLAVHASSVHYAREAKPYALLLLLLVVCAGACVRVAAGGRRGHVFTLAISVTMALYTHNVAVPFLGVLFGVTLLASRGVAGAARAVAASFAVGAVLYAPWVPLVASQVTAVGQSYAWLAPAFQEQFPWQLPMSLASSVPGAPPPIRNGVDNVAPLSWALCVAQLALWAWAVRVRPELLRVSSALWACGLVPLAALLLASMLGTPFYVVGRVDVALVAVTCTALGAAWAVLPRRAAWSVGVVWALVSAGPLWLEVGTDTRSQERSIARALGQAMGRGDVLVVATAHRDTMAFYLGRERPDVGVRAFPSAREQNAFFIPAMTPAQVQEDAAAVTARASSEARAAGGTHAWILAQPGTEADALLGAFAGSHVLEGGRALGFLDLQVHRVALRE